MKIDYEVVRKIEDALGFELRYFQVQYLLGRTHLNSDYRAQGNSTIFAVKKLISEESTYDLDGEDIAHFIDYCGSSKTVQMIMRPMIKDINRKLVVAGFRTCVREG